MANELKDESTKNLHEQYEKKKADCFAFDNELSQLNQGFVQKMNAIKTLQNDLVKLRSQYDKRIDAGDVKGADGVLSDIAKERKKLKILIEDLAKEGQLDEYKKRSESFNQETQRLYQKARENWQAALFLMNQTAALTGGILQSFNHNFTEIEQIISAAKKLSEQIFEE